MKRSGLGQAPEMVLPVGLLLPLMRFGRVRDLLFRAKHLFVAATFATTTNPLDHWRRANVLQKQDTSLDAALSVAHAVWHFAGALLGAASKKRALTRSLRDRTPVRDMAR
jgi:hypothetical protein